MAIFKLTSLVAGALLVSSANTQWFGSSNDTDTASDQVV